MQPITLHCQDGYRLGGHLWPATGQPKRGTIIVNPATGVLAYYYSYYARFLADHGFDVLTYDYRGIGASRPERLRRHDFPWRHWGSLDFEAAVRWARHRDPSGFLGVVGHSIGGFLPGFAAGASQVDRYLTMGAQFAYWRDYGTRARGGLFLKWHVAMPLLTAMMGYFPGRRLGWLEDLPRGVVREWSFRGRRMEATYPKAERTAILARFAAVTAPILAVGMSDDDLATSRAITRALAYYTGAERTHVLLTPADMGKPAVGHFDLFHARHLDTFWTQTLEWLIDGRNPWPTRVVWDALPAAHHPLPAANHQRGPAVDAIAAD